MQMEFFGDKGNEVLKEHPELEENYLLLKRTFEYYH